MEGNSSLIQLLEKARRRHLWNLVLEQAALASSVALGGGILLLLLGTQILDWYWPALLFVTGLALGVWRTWQRVPVPYALAQQIDARLDLHDTLASAYHFREGDPARNPSPSMRQGLEDSAEHLSQTIEPSRAVPFLVPRGVYGTFALVLLVAGLFAVRYGLRRNLDLRPPLVAAVTDFFQSAPQVASAKKQAKKPDPENPLGIALEQQADDRAEKLDPAPDSVLDTIDVPEVNPELADGAEHSPKSKALSSKQLDEGADPGGEEGEASSGDPTEGREQADSRPPGDQGTDQNGPDGLKPPPGQEGENSSLLEKMRDAMANLMSRLKISPKGGDSRQTASNSKTGLPSGEMQRKASQKGAQNSGRPQADGAAGEEQEGSQEGQGQEQAQAGQGNSSDKGSEQAGKNDSRSGMGKQDGAKDLKDAEQLAAMGKISEIFGKRAATVTGEVLVEVPSQKQQQLRTQYSEKNAAHREAGGEIHRDEIPLIFQQYIQQYFEEVRKTPSADTAKPSAKP